MAKSNRDRVAEIMDALRDGLGPFVLREYKFQYKADRYLREIEQALHSNAYSAPDLPDEDAALQEIDAHGWLNLMIRNWHEVFRSKLGHAERSYVSELMEARNAWAHQQAFTNEDAYRVADTATRLLEAVNAPKQVPITKDIAQELLRLRFAAEAKKAKKETGSLDQPPTTMKGLKPWRMVVKPHPDVIKGEYALSEFVANIADVQQGRARDEYKDPKEFFRRTYLTEGLQDLLVTGIRRLTGQGGDPVVQLQTSFGGGKSHSMLAMYHLVSGDIRFSEIPGGENIVKRIGNVDDHITANRAVIVGTAFSAATPRVYDDCTTHTLWGDIAYQLGGIEAYQLVQKADLAGINPGSDTLVQLLEKHGPALIIIDELVAFARNLYQANDRLPAGTFDAVMSFMQSLTEAMSRSSDSILLISIPQSEIEIGGEGGHRALDILSNTIGRIEAIWKPVTATESFEIVRRRLFSDEMDYAARDAVLNAYREMYANNAGEFPSGVGESEYMQRMQDAYPIHPELFDRLYQDWSTLERFQRTRGVLRLMATVIYQLWVNNDQSLLIMPATMPLWSAMVRNEIMRYLPDNWSAILDADVDGDESKPAHIDRNVPILGQHFASRRVARAVFVGSAPSVAEQTVRGVEEVRIRLATVQPGEQLAVFNDALRRMSNQLTYLYTDGSRYWYDTRPTVNRMAQDRAQNISRDLVYQEAIKRLRAVRFRREDFNAAHLAPESSSDVVDEPRARVVVLAPEYGHKRNGSLSDAQEMVKEITESRGTAPRLYRNMLVFIAPDITAAEGWDKALREYLAWKSIEDETEQLNLDAQQSKQVKNNLETANNTVETRLQETYSWLITPMQPEATGAIEYQAQRMSGQDSFYERAARKLRQNDHLIYRWSPDNLRIELERYLWGDGPHLSIKQLWDYLARYCYLPRLYDEKVLIEAIREGVSRDVDPPFGYATMVNDGAYNGLAFGRSATIYMDDQSVLVKPDVAQKQIEQTQPDTTPESRAEPATDSGQERSQLAEPEPRRVTRYHGTVTLDPQRANREMGTIVEEIVQRLTALTGTEVEITVEISARRNEGFDDATMRTISENSRTLKFKNHGFEE